MIPFMPLNDDVGRVIENLEEGLPEEGSPASQGGFGADSPEMTEADIALQQEGSLDEAEAEKLEPQESDQ